MEGVQKIYTCQDACFCHTLCRIGKVRDWTRADAIEMCLAVSVENGLLRLTFQRFDRAAVGGQRVTVAN